MSEVTFPIKRYEMVVSINVDDFNETINEMIATGWIPYGHPMQVPNYWSQAMVHDQDESIKDRDFKIGIPHHMTECETCMGEPSPSYWRVFATSTSDVLIGKGETEEEAIADVKQKIKGIING